MEPYIGEIRIFAGTFAPSGWLFCDGSLLAISQYETLFNLIGTTYGGDGVSNFALPNLEGRIPVGQGSGSGLTPRTLGQSFGEESHTLTTAEIPPHNHPAIVTTGNATSTAPGPVMLYGTAANPDNAHGVYSLYTSTSPSLLRMATMQAGTVANAGGSQPHANIMPSLTVNFIISPFGIYPSSS